MSHKTKQKRELKKQKQIAFGGKRAFWCPSCKKQRLYRSFDHVVSNEKQKYMDRKGNEVELFVDICDYCIIKNHKLHFKPVKESPKKVVKALEKNEDIDLEQAL